MEVSESARFPGAACAGMDTDAFFPERGTAQITARDAKKVCNGGDGVPACPALKECLEYALERKERFGIWGGKSERERARIAKQRRVAAARRELEEDLTRRKRSEAARRAWENRRRQQVEEQEQAVKRAAVGALKENRGKTGVTTRRAKSA